MSKIIKDDAGGVWVNIYKSQKHCDVYWTGSVGYSTKENASTNLVDKLHYIATIDIKKAIEQTAELTKVKQQLATVEQQYAKAKWWLNEIVTNHRFTPISTAERAIKDLEETERKDA